MVSRYCMLAFHDQCIFLCPLRRLSSVVSGDPSLTLQCLYPSDLSDSSDLSTLVSLRLRPFPWRAARHPPPFGAKMSLRASLQGPVAFMQTRVHTSISIYACVHVHALTCLFMYDGSLIRYAAQFGMATCYTKTDIKVHET